MERKENQRVVLTKRLLKEAMLRLLREKELDQVNVSELCREANLNRGTFYKHYTTPREVLEDVQRDVMEGLLWLAPSVRSVDSTKKYLRDICEYLYDRAPVVRILLQCNMDGGLVSLFREINRSYWSQYANPDMMGPMDPADVSLTVTFYSSGSYHLIRQWLMEDIRKKPRVVAEMVFRFIHGEEEQPPV